MRISAIIPAYNAGKYLRRAVESLIQTGHPELEIIIVDDGSKDSTLEIAQIIQSQYSGMVTVFQHPGGANRGVSASRNLGIKKSTGELICFLDADDYVLPHRFKTAVPILLNNDTIDGVYELTGMVFDTVDDKEKWLDDRALFGIREALQGDRLLQMLLSGIPWHPNSFLCRRSLFDRSGLFDETMRFAEDCNLWLRMASIGTIVAGNLFDPVSVYYRHDGNTYQYSLDRRVDLAKAMVDAYRWARRSNVPDNIRQTFSSGIQKYVINAIVVSRENHRQDVCWSMVRKLIRTGYLALLFDHKMLRQLVWLCRESFGL
jgi:glycosyltransferase involved in cell wall biosynthesis